MSLTHIPTVASIINKFQRNAYRDDGIEEIISELGEVCNSWKTTALAVGGKPERAPEFIIAQDAIKLFRQLRDMSRSKYCPVMPGEVTHAP